MVLVARVVVVVADCDRFPHPYQRTDPFSPSGPRLLKSIPADFFSCRTKPSCQARLTSYYPKFYTSRKVQSLFMFAFRSPTKLHPRREVGTLRHKSPRPSPMYQHSTG
ncbi:hypothetical protein CBOM_01158 [Ceraceosorus bombacis]|uniref:Uncharacterized protein n=1 Tax=Ceraceosorus bombacis TaxID=401625 RepID=A0A0P1BCI3_9BASI|nr:hypothetical protein CBOM_01158 [Ceraceosorus bombacis]